LIQLLTVNNAWSPPTRGLLRFDLPPQRQQCAILTTRGLILRPLHRPGLILGPHRRRGKHEHPGLHHPGYVMTIGAAARHWNPPPAACSASTPSPSNSPTTDASAGSPSRGGRNHRRVGRREPIAPPTTSRVSLAGRGSMRLGGARPAGRHARADRPLVLSGKASRWSRAQAQILVARGRLRLP
jgi:hypothetical protein